MSDAQQLEAIIIVAGCEELLDPFYPRENAVAHYLDRLNAAQQVLRDRFGVTADTPTTQLLSEMESADPFKLSAFVQSLVTSRTPEMIAMAWRIIGGSRVRSMSLSFEDRQNFSLSVIAKRGTDPDETYTSSDVNDKRLVQHIVLRPGADAPIFVGFSGLRNFP